MSSLTDVLKDYDLLKSKGNDFFKQGNYTAAAEYYTLAMIANSHEPVIYLNRAQCNLKLEKYFDVLFDCKKALDLSPILVKGYYRRALALKNLSRYRSAINDFKKVVELDASFELAKREIVELELLLKRDPRLDLKVLEKPNQYRCGEPIKMFALNNQYSGSKQYHPN